MVLPPLSNLTKPALHRWEDVSPRFGNTFVTGDGKTIRRGEKLTVSEFLPMVLHPTRVVSGDLIPNSSWGASLSNLLTKQSWDGLRLPLIAQRFHACQLCGTPHRPNFDVHEVWSYVLPSDEKRRMAQADRSILLFGEQVLEGLMVLCHECHECFHLGYAGSQGRLSVVLGRLAALNRWTENQVKSYHDLVFDRYRHHSRFCWTLDFRKLSHPEGGLVLKGGWQLLNDGSGLLNKGDQYTGIGNIPWRFSKESDWRPAQSFS